MIPVYKGKRKGILVISGGGAKGLSALGAIDKLIEDEIIIKPDILCGTSAGAMISLLLNIGYHPKEIYNVLLNIDFNTLVICDVEDIFTDVHFGINSPKPFKHIIETMIKHKNFQSNITFKELKDKTNQTLIITGTCVNTTSLEYFSSDLTPNMSVLEATQISIAMPFIFKPYQYDNKVWIDGGCMNNYPIELFHDNLNDVVGIYLGEQNNEHAEFNEIQTYFLQVLKCVQKGMNLTKVEFYKKYTIHVKSTGDQTINWEMTSEQKELLFKEGYDEAVIYCKNN
jgi:NTE family protein